MSKEFNFRRAWRELAGPAYEKLSQEIKDLYMFVVTDCRDCHQDKSLNVPFPDAELKSRFEAFSSRELAVAARTIYFWGQWGHTGQAIIELHGKPVHEITGNDFDWLEPAPSVKAYIKQRLGDPWLKEADFNIKYVKFGPTDIYGAYWKFTNFCDQVLNARLGFSNARLGFSAADGQRHCRHWMALTGQLRHHSDECDGWSNADVGWATEEHWAKVQHVRENWADFVKKGRLDDVVIKEVTKDDPDEGWFHTDRFMDHKPETKYNSDELSEFYQPAVEEEFTVLDVRAVNHKVKYGRGYPAKRRDKIPNDHPFMIGRAHMKGDSIFITGHEAPCHACGESLEAHTHETAMLLQPRKQLANAEAATALMRLKALMEERDDSIDGFAFIESPDGFTIDEPLETKNHETTH